MCAGDIVGDPGFNSAETGKPFWGMDADSALGDARYVYVVSSQPNGWLRGVADQNI